MADLDTVNRNKAPSLMARWTGKSVAISILAPWITILVFALLTLASTVYTARNFAINTDISNLISPHIDWRQREIALERRSRRGSIPFWRSWMRRPLNWRRLRPIA